MGHTKTDVLLSVQMGLLSGLEAQSEIGELLDELFGDAGGVMPKPSR